MHVDGLQPGLLAVVTRDDALPFVVAGVVALAAWGVLATIVLMATRPKLPDAGPETMELGPEPPAVANFVVHRSQVTGAAIAATLLDLASRRFLDIDQVAPETFLCRLYAHRPDKGEVTPYEAKVLALVREKATKEGTVAVEELSLGSGPQAGSWWKDFAKDVIDDARHRGLCRRRWGTLPAVLVAAGLAVPLLLGGGALEVLSAVARAGGSTADSDDPGGGLALAGFAWFAIVAFGASRLRAWRETPAGSRAAAHWLGFRNHVRETELLMDAPPAAVVIWGRNLSYGVALGACPAASQRLPIGPQSDDEAWSAYGGLWREVSITYPKRFWEGEAPSHIALVAGGWALLTGAVFLVWLRAVGGGLWDIAGSLFDTGNVWLSLGIGAAATLALGTPLIWSGLKFTKAAVALSRAVPDLTGGTVTFEGQVLRVPWHNVTVGDSTQWRPTGFSAIYDGTGDEVRAVRFQRFDVNEGDVVRVTMTARMRHVLTCEVLPEATAALHWQGRTGPAATPTSTVPATGGLAAPPPVPGVPGLPGLPGVPGLPGGLGGLLAAAGGLAGGPQPPAPPAVPAAAPVPSTAASPAPGVARPDGLDADVLHRLTGLQLHPAQPDAQASGLGVLTGLLQGGSRQWAFTDGAGGQLLAVCADGGQVGVLARRSLQLLGHSGNRIADLGDTAAWLRETALVVSAGTSVIVVQTSLPADPTARLAAARAVAEHLLAAPS